MLKFGLKTPTGGIPNGPIENPNKPIQYAPAPEASSILSMLSKTMTGETSSEKYPGGGERSGDYLAGEHYVVNDPNLGPWTPEEYKKYKYTKKADWLKEHPEDWGAADLMTMDWYKQLQENTEPLINLLQGMTHPETSAGRTAITGAVKGLPRAVAGLPGAIKEQVTGLWNNPARYYGEHPEASLYDLLAALGGAGAASARGAASPAAAIPRQLGPGIVPKGLLEGRGTRFGESIPLGESRLLPSQAGPTRIPLSRNPSATPLFESTEMLQRKFSPMVSEPSIRETLQDVLKRVQTTAVPPEVGQGFSTPPRYWEPKAIIGSEAAVPGAEAGRLQEILQEFERPVSTTIDEGLVPGAEAASGGFMRDIDAIVDNILGAKQGEGAVLEDIAPKTSTVPIKKAAAKKRKTASNQEVIDLIKKLLNATE